MAEIYIWGTDRPPYKIGYSRSAKKRGISLRCTGTWYPHDCASGAVLASFSIEREKAKAAEAEIHRLLSYCRIQKYEWFNDSFEVLEKVASSVVASMAGENTKGDEVRTFTFQVDDGMLDALDELRRVEPDVPSRGKMLNRLVLRSAQPSLKPRESFTQVKDRNPLIKPCAPAENPVPPRRSSSESPMAKIAGKQTGTICPDCGANIGNLKWHRNCPGRPK